MFEFNQKTPEYSNPYYKIADALSGFLFTIGGGMRIVSDSLFLGISFLR